MHKSGLLLVGLVSLTLACGCASTSPATRALRSGRGPAMQQVRVLLAAGMVDEAAAIVRGLVRQSPGDGEVLLLEAQVEAAQGHYREAIDTLQTIELATATPTLRARVASRYEDCLVLAVCAAVNDAVAKGVASVSVADFRSGGAAEAAATAEGVGLAEAVEAALPNRTKARVFTRRSLDEVLREATFTQGAIVDPKTRAQLQLKGVEALVCGSIKDRVSVSVVRVRDGEVVAACQLPHLAMFVGRPTDDAGWKRLDAATTAAANPAMSVDVWTDKRAYTVGERARISFRVNQPAYVTLFDLQTDGTMYVIFPNRFCPNNFCRPDVIYSVPDSNLWWIDVKAPAGVEGIKAVATRRPLDLPGAGGRDVFREIGAVDQESFLADLHAVLRALPTVGWAAAKWTFRIEAGR